MGHVTANVTQQTFRGRNDDGSQTGASWIALANTNWTQAADVPFRVRFVIEETAGGSANNYSYVLQYNRNGTGWVTQGMTGVVHSTASAFVTDATPTTQQISSGAFVAGEFDSDAGASNITLSSQKTEMEYCLVFDGALISNNDTIQLRITNAGTPIDGYINTPSITATVAVVTNINTTADALVLTEQAATVQANVDTNVTTTQDSLVVTPVAATVSQAAAQEIVTTADSLVITEQAATVQANVDTNVTTTADSLVITEQAATVQAAVNTNINTTADSLVITEQSATVQADVDRNINTTADSLVITEQSATVSQSIAIVINTTAGALVITEQSASIQANVDTNVNTTSDSLVVTPTPATVSAQVSTNINTTADALSFSTVKAKILVPVFVNTTPYSIIITGQSASVVGGELKLRGKFDGKNTLSLSGAFATTTLYCNGNDYFTID